MKTNIWKKYQFIDYIDVKNNDLSNKLPVGTLISTMCGKCKMNTELNIENIKNYLPLDMNDILTVKINDDNIRTLLTIKKKRASKKKINSKPFFNGITVVMRINEGECEDLNKEKKINLKLFKNGSIQISGLKDVNHLNRALNKLVYRLTQIKAKMIDSKIEEIYFINNFINKNIEITGFNIYMINSIHRVNMIINRENLYKLLLKKKVKVTYEKCSRACVVIQYIPTRSNKEEKDISIYIFEKGSITINGAQNINQIIDSYNYINNIILTHCDEINKGDEESESAHILKLYDEVIKDYGHTLTKLL
jgi:hypothetical protein